MLVALADAHEPDIASFLDAAAADLDGWEA
ncbi:hypothetical protein [Komagataeibacter xylinus]|nr:hypothetical protein [Komagataeibacter xylinus]